VTTVEDIFRKFDMLLIRELTFCEFKGFCECIGRQLTEKEFQNEYLNRFNSTEKGLTLQGFKDFWLDSLSRLNEHVIYQWLENLGYDQDLYSCRSRCFIFTLHSVEEVCVTVRDAMQTDFDSRANLLITDRFGMQQQEQSKVCTISYTFSEQIHAYSYSLTNNLDRPVNATLDLSHSQRMLFSSKTPLITKRLEPGATEFFMHCKDASGSG